ncbi:MAG: hypothetical protein AUI14_25160 [Actinobacteria bacterium 13_2_20CM_2_71_6]|nr:MAG: hypothetical protein AUI14_25160 [Actinobacteria bacterium 13_2_20CM_2_71_6]
MGIPATLFLALCALWTLRAAALLVVGVRRRAADQSWGPPMTGPVSVVVPAYNEKHNIAAVVRSLARGDHPGGIEVLVVDDGSTDGTADIVRALALPNVRVVSTSNAGKPSALNTGVALARHDLVVLVDADTVVAPDAVGRLVQPFADLTVGAVAGNVKVGNRSTTIARWQHVEYVTGFNLDRRLYDLLGCMPTVPGALGAFRRTALAGAGGMSNDTLAEDTDITMALLREGWQVVYDERAHAWTEAPATLRQLWRQRHRWSYGTVQAMWKHRRSTLDGGSSGRFGRLGLPIMATFGILAPLLAPLLDVLALRGLLVSDPTLPVAWLALLGLQYVVALVAFHLDRERFRPLWTLPVQQLAYRHLTCLVLIRSGMTALTGTRLPWRPVRRTGLGMPDVAAPVPPAGSVVSAGHHRPA